MRNLIARLIARLISRRVRELEAALVLERIGRQAADRRAAKLQFVCRLLAHQLVEVRTENLLLSNATEREVAAQ